MKHPAHIVSSTDGQKDGYKNGWIRCQSCGWHKKLGDGFLQTTIETCANCDPDVSTHTQTQLTTGRPGAYTVRYGSFLYMHTDTISVLIKKCVHLSPFH